MYDLLELKGPMDKIFNEARLTAVWWTCSLIGCYNGGKAFCFMFVLISI